MSYKISTAVLTVIIFACPALLPAPSGHSSAAVQTDLYRVSVESRSQADILNRANMDPVLSVAGGYLIIAHAEEAERLRAAGVHCELIESGIARRHLAMDYSEDQSSRDRIPVVYKGDYTVLYRVDPDDPCDAQTAEGLGPLGTENMKIIYRNPDRLSAQFRESAFDIDLDSLIDCVSQDSLESYSYALQGFPSRMSGSPINHLCALWLYDKLQQFGYDSLVFDSFIGVSPYGYIASGKNIFAYKPGIVYSHDHIIVGAHFDGVYGSPAADDNGSGVAAVLEIARILSSVETDLTIIFALWDAEEDHLVGSWHHASEFAQTDERIVFVLNMDMIAHISNTDEAYGLHGQNDYFATLWAHLADSLESIGIGGLLQSAIYSSSDHRSYMAYGYDVLSLKEKIWSTNYHQRSDSTTYLNFDYHTRMTMASLATVYYVDESHVPEPAVFISWPDGPPEIIDPESTPTATLYFEEYAGALLNPNSPSMSYSINSTQFESTPMTALGGNLYEAVFPSLSCGDIIEYYFSAAEQTTGALYFCPSPASPAVSINAVSMEYALDDNFETDLGWSVSGSATSGHWERYRAVSNGDNPTYDFDYSGRCYITDHSILEDVDNGATVLESPPIEVPYGRTELEYAFWFDNGDGMTGNSDIFRVFLFDGSDWIKIDSAGPHADADLDWHHREFWLHDFCTPTGPIILRFVASDEGFDSYVEAAVDAVKLTYYTYAPTIITASLPDGFYGEPYSQQLEAKGCVEPLVWTDKIGGLDGTGLSLSPDGLIAGTPSDTGIILLTALVEDAAGTPKERDYTFRLWLPVVCGDADLNYELNIGDGVFLIDYIFKGGPAPEMPCVGDSNADGDINVADAIYLINYIFKGGAPPPEACCQ